MFLYKKSPLYISALFLCFSLLWLYFITILHNKKLTSIETLKLLVYRLNVQFLNSKTKVKWKVNRNIEINN